MYLTVGAITLNLNECLDCTVTSRKIIFATQLTKHILRKNNKTLDMHEVYNTILKGIESGQKIMYFDTKQLRLYTHRLIWLIDTKRNC